MTRGVLGGFVLAVMCGVVSDARADNAFERIDRDGDGFISRAEAEEYRGGRFQAWDANKNGAVSRQEMMERIQQRVMEKVTERFEELDLNGDGQVEAPEYQQRRSGRFDELDADGDGRISPEELRQGRL